MGVRVTLPTEDQRLPLPGRHDLQVQVWFASLLLQIGEFSDVMHLHLTRRSADLTLLRLEPLHQLRAEVVGRSDRLIDEDRVLLPPEGDAAEGGYQRLLALPRDDQLD